MCTSVLTAWLIKKPINRQQYKRKEGLNERQDDIKEKKKRKEYRSRTPHTDKEYYCKIIRSFFSVFYVQKAMF